MLLPPRQVKSPTKVEDSLQKKLIPFHLSQMQNFDWLLSFKEQMVRGMILHWVNFITHFLAHLAPCTPLTVLNILDNDNDVCCGHSVLDQIVKTLYVL